MEMLYSIAFIQICYFDPIAEIQGVDNEFRVLSAILQLIYPRTKQSIQNKYIFFNFLFNLYKKIMCINLN